MSIRVMTAVWDHSPYESGELLVLLALADWADDQGRCWPSVQAIAQKARLKERQVYNILQKFRADEIIQCAPGGGRGHSTNYLINTAKIAGFASQKKTLQPIAEKPCTPVHTNPAMECKSPRPPNRKNRHLTVSEPSIKTNLSPTPFQERKGARSQDPAVVDIAEMVCERCKFTSERTFRVITEVLALERDGAGLAETAERLVKAWENYREAAEWLRFTWGPPKFFSEGHWQDNASWPYDEERLRRAREARVGAR
jgi:Helix-turn-helix domain